MICQCLSLISFASCSLQSKGYSPCSLTLRVAPFPASLLLTCAALDARERLGRDGETAFLTEQRNRTIPSCSHIPILQSRLLHFLFRYGISVWHPLFWDAARRRACGDFFSLFEASIFLDLFVECDAPPQKALMKNSGAIIPTPKGNVRTCGWLAVVTASFSWFYRRKNPGERR